MLLPEDMSDDDILCLVAYLSGRFKTDVFKKLYALFGSEFLLFLSIFEDQVIKVPSCDYVSRLMEYSRIYTYLLNGDFSEEAYDNASEMFKRSKSNLRRVVRKVTLELDRIIITSAFKKQLPVLSSSAPKEDKIAENKTSSKPLPKTKARPISRFYKVPWQKSRSRKST